MSLEHELPVLLDELAERHVVEPPPPFGELRTVDDRSVRRSSRFVAFGAAAACVSLLVAGLLLLPFGDSSSSTTEPVSTDQIVDPEPSLVGEIDSGGVDLVRIDARTTEVGTTEVRLVFDGDVPDAPPERIDDPANPDSSGLGAATQVSVDEWISVCGDGHSFPPPGNRTVDVFIPVDWFEPAAVIEPPVGPLDPDGRQPAKIIVCEPRNGFVQVSVWGAASGEFDDVDIRVDGAVIAITIEPDADVRQDADPTTTAGEDPLSPGSSLTRPIADRSVCGPVSANETFVRGLTLFARPSNNPVPIQIIARADSGPTGPFAIMQRYFGDDRTATGGDQVVVNGTTFHVSVLDNGNGEVEWDVGDGSFGYIRSRDLSRDELVAVIETITPRPTDAPISGFDASIGGDLELLHEGVNTDIVGRVSSSECTVSASGYRYRITSVSGDPIFEYGAVADRPVPIDVGERDDTVVVINGIDHPLAPSVDDIIQADQDEWSEMLSQPQWVDLSNQPLGEGESIVVPLVAADSSVELSPLTLRLVRTQGVLNLEIDSSDAVLAPDAAFWRVDLEPGGGGMRTAHVGSTLGFRVHDGPHDTPIAVTVDVIDGGEFVLQTTGTITLTPT